MRHLLALAFFMVLSCCTTAPPSIWDREATRLEVTTMLTTYHDAMNEGGILTEFDYLDDSEEFFWVPPGYESALNYDAIRVILEANAPLYTSITVEWETLEVLPLSPDIASFHGIVSGIWEDSTGHKMDMRILESGTTILRSDGWKLLSGQSRVLE